MSRGSRTHNDFDVLTWLAPDGSVVSHSQKRIIQAIQCTLKDAVTEPLDNHHELVNQAVAEVESESADPSTAGILGNRFSTRFLLIELLDHYYRQDTSIFFSEENKEDLKLAIDEIKLPSGVSVSA